MIKINIKSNYFMKIYKSYQIFKTKVIDIFLYDLADGF